jgi:large subunit ribosomal protein L31
MPGAERSFYFVRRNRHRVEGASAARRVSLRVEAFGKEQRMKGIHPAMTKTRVRCNACGDEFTTRSTRSELVLDVCASCHPAYTGVERPTARGSRIERFERRRRAATI